jgi:hypothetical protein
MKIADFLQAVEAEVVGGRLKAVIDGVHHFVAELVDGNPILTAAGAAAKEELESKAPATLAVIANVAPALQEVQSIVSDPAALAGAGAGDASGIVAAVVKGAAEKAAVQGVDALLDGITAKVAPKAKTAKAAS